MIGDGENESAGCIQSVTKIMHYNNIQNQLTDSLSTRLMGNMIYMILGLPTIMALTISALSLGLLWVDNNVYALNNNRKPALQSIQPLNKLPNITIITNSSSLYSIPSASVQLYRFSVNYAISGKISSLMASALYLNSLAIKDARE